MVYFFGEPKSVKGSSSNRGKIYQADDYVTAEITFGDNVSFNGIWDYTAKSHQELDLCEIRGTRGTLRFPIFKDGCQLDLDGKTNDIYFPPIEHVQQPMIEQVVNYFLGKGPNPCSAAEGLIVMQIMDQVIGNLK
jgi:predicted dehydrogenase